MEAQAIKDIKDIEKIKRYLLKNNRMRDYCLFTVGVNVALRISDLLTLKVQDVQQECIYVQEQKTNKRRAIKINDSCRAAINKYLSSLDSYEEEDFLFKSRVGENKALSTRAVNQMLAAVQQDCKLKVHLSSHSLRKTACYHMYINNADNPMILPLLMRLLNHTSQAITLRYIGIQQEQIEDLYEELNL